MLQVALKREFHPVPVPDATCLMISRICTGTGSEQYFLNCQYEMPGHIFSFTYGAATVFTQLYNKLLTFRRDAPPFGKLSRLIVLPAVMGVRVRSAQKSPIL